MLLDVDEDDTVAVTEGATDAELVPLVDAVRHAEPEPDAEPVLEAVAELVAV